MGRSGKEITAKDLDKLGVTGDRKLIPSLLTKNSNLVYKYETTLMEQWQIYQMQEMQENFEELQNYIATGIGTRGRRLIANGSSMNEADLGKNYKPRFSIQNIVDKVSEKYSSVKQAVGKYMGGLFGGASKTLLPTEAELNGAVSEWSRMQKSLAPSNRQAAKFNTGTVVYDAKTGQYYYGMNRGVQISGDKLNTTLSKMLPEKSLNDYKLGNCAEVDAVNQALNNAANMSDLYMYTINVNTGTAKGMCANCSYTFNGNVANVLSK